MADNRLIVALDFSSFEETRNIVEQLGDYVSYYKVGMELFYSTGGKVISYLRELEKDIFLDLKLHDIPNTVAKSAAALTRQGVSMLNVHAAGGRSMMQATMEAVKNEAHILGICPPKVLAVTILTSISSQEWQELSYNTSITDQVGHLAKLAHDAGLDGVVASPQEANNIRNICGADFDIVTPGIRPKGAANNDQNRVATPAGALQLGASHLVIGRPITASDDPLSAVKSILSEMRDTNE